MFYRLREIFAGFNFLQKFVLISSALALFGTLSLIFIKNIDLFPKKIDGVSVSVLERGEGRVLKSNDSAVISYIGFLEDGEEFDRADNFSFKFGDGTVLKSWELAMAGMKIGEIRRVNIEPLKAYGDTGIPGLVPPNSKVIFEIKLVDIK